MGLVSRKRVWVESMGVASRCGCKDVYKFTHITCPYILLLYLLFFAATSLLFVHFVKSFKLFYLVCNSTQSYNKISRVLITKSYKTIEIIFFTQVSSFHIFTSILIKLFF